MLTAYKSMIKKTFCFGGTVSVKEYWKAMTMYGILLGAFLAFIAFLGAGLGVFGDGSQVAGVLFLVISVGVFFLPLISLHIRRLRHASRPWWVIMLLILGIPVLGLFLACSLNPPSAAGKRWPVGLIMILAGMGMYLWSAVIPMLTGLPIESMGFLAYPGLILGTVGLIVARMKAPRNDA